MKHEFADLFVFDDIVEPLLVDAGARGGDTGQPNRLNQIAVFIQDENFAFVAFVVVRKDIDQFLID